jgi:class 3 adenylate cyclase
VKRAASPVSSRVASIVHRFSSLDQDAEAVQALIVGWHRRGYQVGFGVGLARGEATVGRIGYEGRLDYTAIGSVTNLASRLCSAAEDRQILIDEAAAATVTSACATSSSDGTKWRGAGRNGSPVTSSTGSADSGASSACH